MEFNIDRIHILFIAVILIVSVLFYTVSYQDKSAKSFIIRCNEIHGESNWQVDRLSEWTTYSDEFWKTYPRVYMNDDPFITNTETYSCFDKRQK